MSFPAPFTDRKAAFVVAIVRRNHPGNSLKWCREREGHRLMNLTWSTIRIYECLTRPHEAGKLKDY